MNYVPPSLTEGSAQAGEGPGEGTGTSQDQQGALPSTGFWAERLLRRCPNFGKSSQNKKPNSQNICSVHHVKRKKNENALKIQAFEDTFCRKCFEN